MEGSVKFIQDNLGYIAGTLFLIPIGGYHIISGEFSRQMERSSKLRQERQEQSDRLLRQEIQLEAQAEESRLADERYERFCQMLVSKDLTQILPVTEGEAVMSLDGRKLADGSLICDDRGVTAEIQEGVATNLLISRDAALYNQRAASALSEWTKRTLRSNVTAKASPEKKPPISIESETEVANKKGGKQ
ncbi:MAG: hypothetical protein ACRC62_04720 [Microcoleus sp.]